MKIFQNTLMLWWIPRRTQTESHVICFGLNPDSILSGGFVTVFVLKTITHANTKSLVATYSIDFLRDV